jgi:hypothetical protein
MDLPRQANYHLAILLNGNLLEAGCQVEMLDIALNTADYGFSVSMPYTFL